MCKEDWKRHPAIGVAIFALVGLIIAAQASPEIPALYPRCAGNEVYGANGECSVSGAVSPASPLYFDDWREDKNLEAQQWMMFWAGAMFFVTAVGVWYVAGTLDATRAAVEATNRATDETREIGEAQVRAYLSVTKAVVVEPEYAYYAFDIIVTAKNFGQSPAFNFNWCVEPSLQYFWGDNRLAPSQSDLPRITPYDTPTILSAGSEATFRFSIATTDVEGIMSACDVGDLYMIGSVEIFWKDVFGKDERGYAWFRPVRNEHVSPSFRGELSIANHAPEEGDKPEQKA